MSVRHINIDIVAFFGHKLHAGRRAGELRIVATQVDNEVLLTITGESELLEFVEGDNAQVTLTLTYEYSGEEYRFEYSTVEAGDTDTAQVFRSQVEGTSRSDMAIIRVADATTGEQTVISVNDGAPGTAQEVPFPVRPRAMLDPRCKPGHPANHPIQCFEM